MRVNYTFRDSGRKNLFAYFEQEAQQAQTTKQDEDKSNPNSPKRSESKSPKRMSKLVPTDDNKMMSPKNPLLMLGITPGGQGKELSFKDFNFRKLTEAPLDFTQKKMMMMKYVDFLQENKKSYNDFKAEISQIKKKRQGRMKKEEQKLDKNPIDSKNFMYRNQCIAPYFRQYEREKRDMIMNMTTENCLKAKHIREQIELQKRERDTLMLNKWDYYRAFVEKKRVEREELMRKILINTFWLKNFKGHQIITTLFKNFTKVVKIKRNIMIKNKKAKFLQAQFKVHLRKFH